MVERQQDLRRWEGAGGCALPFIGVLPQPASEPDHREHGRVSIENMSSAPSDSTRPTYDLTLTKLTSLEEMTKTMMEEDLVRCNITNKLWQVYSKLSLAVPHCRPPTFLLLGSPKSLPACQHRGAIIVDMPLACLHWQNVVSHQRRSMCCLK